MKFRCIEGCRDQGVPERTRPVKQGERTITIPVTYNYHMDRMYDIAAEQVLHLARVGLFPEMFEAADDMAREWLTRHTDDLCDIVDGRVLPYRSMTPEEEENDRLVKAGKKEGKMFLPVGPDQPQKIKLQRLTRKAVPPSSPEQVPQSPAAQSGRRPMSEEAKAAARTRLQAARDKKAAMRAAVPAGA